MRQLARTTAIFNPFSEAVATIEDHCRQGASMSGHVAVMALVCRLLSVRLQPDFGGSHRCKDAHGKAEPAVCSSKIPGVCSVHAEELNALRLEAVKPLGSVAACVIGRSKTSANNINSVRREPGEQSVTSLLHLGSAICCPGWRGLCICFLVDACLWRSRSCGCLAGSLFHVWDGLLSVSGRCGRWRGRQQSLIHFLRPWPSSKITVRQGASMSRHVAVMALVCRLQSLSVCKPDFGGSHRCKDAHGKA